MVPVSLARCSIAWLAASVLCAGALAQTTSKPADFDALARRAKAAHAAQKLDEALALYQKALGVRPGWSEGRFALGSILYDRGRYEEARVEFRRVTAQEPKSGAAWASKGLCEFQLRNHEKALADLQHARVLGLTGNRGLMAAAEYHAAILLIRFGQYEAARDILRKFVREDQDSPGVIEALGLAVLRMPYLPAEAPADKREMITIAGRAFYQLSKNRYSPTARMAIEELVTRFPEEPNVHYAKGAFLLSVEEGEAGLAEFRRVLAMQPSHVPAMLQLAFHMIKEGRYEEARPYAENAVLAEPESFAAHNALGRVLLELDQTDRAIAELETATRLAPGSVQTYFALARAYQRAGRTEDVKRARETFIRLEAEQRAEQDKARGAAAQEPATQEPPLEPVPPEQ
jgi:tetratricopeptide (TPR) repeat protein